jgi:serine/threonine protein kinase
MQDVVALVRTMPQDLNASIQSNRQLIQSDMSLFLERAITTLCQQMHATTSEWAENSTQHRRQSPLYQHRRTAGVEQHQYSPSTSWRSRQHRPRTPVLSCSDEESESSRNARPSHASQTLSCRARFNNLRKVAEQLDQASSRMEADFELSSSWFPETYTQKTRVPKFLCARYQVLAPQTGEQLLEWHIWWSDSPRRWRMIRVTTAAKQQHKNFADEALTMQKWYSQYLWVSPTQLALPCSTSQLMAYISCEGALADDVTNLTLRADQTTKLVELCEDENKPYEPEDACYKSTYRSAEYLLDAQSLGCRIILEREVIIQDIVSGFTARVLIDGRECIEKKLPLAPVHLNPFLYEMKALYLLRHCPGIIRFVGVEVDNAGKKLQGFIRGCEDSDLSGLLRELYKRRQHIPWSLKEKWAGQLLTGVLSAHKSGLVIGTLDVNEIGVDEKQDAKLLHVGHGRCDERSGCLAPELRLRVNHTDATQRLSDVHMNARQDIFALGLVLWLIAQTDIPYTFITDSRTHGRKPWWKRLFCHKAHCTRGESVAEASWCTKDHTDPVDLPPCDNSTPLYFQHLIARCRASVPAQRATAQELMAIYKEHRGYSNDQWFP